MWERDWQRGVRWHRLRKDSERTPYQEATRWRRFFWSAFTVALLEGALLLLCSVLGRQ